MWRSSEAHKLHVLPQYAATVAMNAEYHLLVGVSGTLVVAGFEAIDLLTSFPATRSLIQSGR